VAFTKCRRKRCASRSPERKDRTNPGAISPSFDSGIEGFAYCYKMILVVGVAGKEEEPSISSQADHCEELIGFRLRIVEGLSSLRVLFGAKGLERLRYGTSAAPSLSAGLMNCLIRWPDRAIRIVVEMSVSPLACKAGKREGVEDVRNSKHKLSEPIAGVLRARRADYSGIFCAAQGSRWSRNGLRASPP